MLSGYPVTGKPETKSNRASYHVVTTVAVAIVGSVLVYSNVTPQYHGGTFLGGAANNHYTQGWPLAHRTLVKLEQDPLANDWPMVETRIIDSSYAPIKLFCNLVVAASLCLSVWLTHRLRKRASVNFRQLDLTSLFFVTTMLGMLANEIAREYHSARFLSDLLGDNTNHFSMPNLFTFLPVVYAITCTGYIAFVILLIGFRFVIPSRIRASIDG